MPKPNDFELIYAMVRRIPVGKVAAYGHIARWLGWPRGARTVGWALRALRDGSDVPWQRVVNAQGHLSLGTDGSQIQRALLEAEGIAFDTRGRINMQIYGWQGPNPWEDLAKPAT